MSHNNEKTSYDDDRLSDMNGRNRAIILGMRPRSNKMFDCWGLTFPNDNDEVIKRFQAYRKNVGYREANKWRSRIIEDIDRDIRRGSLRRIPAGSPCNLYVMFNLFKGNPPFPDVDNLLKLFLDALKEQGKDNFRDYHFLIEDDVYFRGIRAEKELVDSEEEEGVVLSYFVTKTFEITSAIDIVEKTDLKNYREGWEYPIRLIGAKEHRVLNGKKIVSKEYWFIDNAPGQVVEIKESGEMHPDAIPGYNWKKGDIVEGCMVFKREPKSDKAEWQNQYFYWLKKWSSLF